MSPAFAGLLPVSYRQPTACAVGYRDIVGFADWSSSPFRVASLSKVARNAGEL